MTLAYASSRPDLDVEQPFKQALKSIFAKKGYEMQVKGFLKSFLSLVVITLLLAGPLFAAALSTWDNQTTAALYTAAKSGNQTSFQQLLALAEAGDALAQVDVAIGYDDGLGVAKDMVAANGFAHKALSALTQAAGQGNPVAEGKLGLLYMKGLGVGQDYAQALQWYRASAAQGDSESQRLLGVMYEFGRGVPLDKSQALEWLQKSADQGNQFSQLAIGNMYRDGEGVPRDYATSLKWLQKSADQGSAEAMANLGYMYQSGYGVPKDYAHAVKLYQMSAAEGGLWGQRLLGQMYEQGWGVPQDKAQAVMWYRKAAAQGDPLSQVKIGQLGTNGDLSHAAAKGDAQEVARLLNAGIDHDALGNALWSAVYGRSAEVVTLLVAHGADVNEKDQFGVTPLVAAARQGNKDVIETLIAHGADINPKECSDQIPLFAAIPFYYPIGGKSDDVIQLLISKGAKVNATDCKGMTALHVAASRDLGDTAVLLVLDGADVNAKNDAGQTPFDVAPKQPPDHNHDVAHEGSDGLFARIGYGELFSPAYSDAKPGFQCGVTHALTHVESEICAVPLLRELDGKMTDAYSAALKTAKDPDSVRKEQRAWLADRNEKCDPYTPECSIGHLVAWYDRRIALLGLSAAKPANDLTGLTPLVGATTDQPSPIPLVGATAEARMAFLKQHLSAEAQDYPSAEDRKKEIPYILGALQDPDVEIRRFATSNLFDESELPAMIHAMAEDTDPGVRQGAAIWMSLFITSNGAETCNSVTPVSQHLDELLLGLDDKRTAQHISEILLGYAGDAPLPCCMTPKLKGQVIAALEAHNASGTELDRLNHCPAIPNR